MQAILITVAPLPRTIEPTSSRCNYLRPSTARQIGQAVVRRTQKRPPQTLAAHRIRKEQAGRTHESE
eukprot:4761476-Pleurochrysis_carterae.AAC.5